MDIVSTSFFCSRNYLGISQSEMTSLTVQFVLCLLPVQQYAKENFEWVRFSAFLCGLNPAEEMPDAAVTG